MVSMLDKMNLLTMAFQNPWNVSQSGSELVTISGCFSSPHNVLIRCSTAGAG